MLNSHRFEPGKKPENLSLKPFPLALRFTHSMDHSLEPGGGARWWRLMVVESNGGGGSLCCI